MMWVYGCIVLTFCVALPAQGSVTLTGQVATSIQSLTSEPGEEETGFGDPRANLQAEAEPVEGIKAFAEIHNNPLDPDEPLSNLTDPGDLALREAYVTLKNFFPKADLMLGRRDLRFGAQHRERSVNARVQHNPLIGNHLNDFGGPETGLHFYSLLRGWGFDRMIWNFSLTNGTRDATVESGTSPAVTAALNVRLAPGLYLKGSWYHVDHDDDVSRGSSFVASDGEPYRLSDGVSSFVTQRDLWTEVDAWQVDLSWQGEGWNLSGYYGVVEVDRDFPTDDFDGSKADYWHVQGGVEVLSRTQASVRWSEFDADEPIPGDGLEEGADVDRFQIGLWHVLQPQVHLKVEYVKQTSTLAGLEFDGFIGDVSVAF